MRVGLTDEKQNDLYIRLQKARSALGVALNILERTNVDQDGVWELMRYVQRAQERATHVIYLSRKEMESWSKMAKAAGTELELAPRPETQSGNGPKVDPSDVPSLASGDSAGYRFPDTKKRTGLADLQSAGHAFDELFAKSVAALIPELQGISLCSHCSKPQHGLALLPDTLNNVCTMRQYQHQSLTPISVVAPEGPQQSRSHISSLPLASPLPSLDLVSGHFGNLKIMDEKGIVQNEGQN